DLTGGTQVRLAPGMELSGIDFQMQPATGVSVRGHVQPLPPDSQIQLNLRPKDPLLRRRSQGSRVDPRTGEFVITGVRPGSYELVATVRGTPPYWAQVAIEVGANAPEPVDVML